MRGAAGLQAGQGGPEGPHLHILQSALSLALAVVLTPAGAAAHALDEYVQAARLSLTRSHVDLDMDLTPGVEVASSVVAMIDLDRDGAITPLEAAAYATRVLQDTTVELDGERVAMAVSRIDVPPIADMREGMGTIHLSAHGVHGVSLAGSTRLAFRNDHAPEGSVYLVNALVPDDRAVAVVRQERDWLQRSARIVYDVRPGSLAQIVWTVVAMASTLGLIVWRRRGVPTLP
jgi:hypothetical protein